jgi:hypothetical protein
MTSRNLEGRAIPGVGVASTEFVQAAAAQAQSLGIDPEDGVRGASDPGPQRR